MKMKLIAVLLSFVVMNVSMGFSIQTYFSPNGGARARLVTLIQTTTPDIDVAIYSFTSKELGLAIAAAAQSGRRVRVIADRDQNKGKASVLSWISKYMDVRILPEPGVRGIMHDKFMLIGNQYLTTGSYNWTNNAEFFNQENLLVITEPETIRSFHQEFDKLWQKARPYKKYDTSSY